MKEYKHKEYLVNVLPCLYYGVICGAITGAFIFFFKLIAKKAETISRWVYESAKGSPLYMALVFAGLILLGFAMVFLHKHVPEVKGGGIPRSEGVLRGKLSFRWFKTLVGTFFGSMISFVCGLPLGSEGPAVLIGTSMGRMCGTLSKNQSWNRYIMTGGAGAGFAVATGAPFSGILFALEEIHKRFTPMLVLIVSVSVISASTINQLLCSAFGISANLFEFEPLAEIQLKQIGYLLLLGVLVAAAVAVFDSSISLFSSLTRKFKKYLNGYVKVIFVFVITGILGFVSSDAIYSGHDVIHHVITGNQTVLFLLALFAVRLLMMLFVTDSSVTGGIFIPTLAIGALVGALSAKLLVVMGLPQELFPNIVLLGMCSFIGGTLRAPLTAAVLFIELTGQFQNMLYVTVVIFMVNAITELINLTPFYDRTLENMEHTQNEGKMPIIASFEMKISPGSFVVGKTVRDIMWPASSVVVSVTRAEETRQDMDNDGEKKLLPGDRVVLRAKFFDEAELRQLLGGLVGTEQEIVRLERI